MIIAQGFASLDLFQNLTKEHLLKDCASRSHSKVLPYMRLTLQSFVLLTAVSLNFLTDFCRAYLTQGSQEHLLKVLKSAFKDLIDVFPAGQKNRAALEVHFKAQGMGFVGEWYTKRVATLVKEEMSRFVVSSLDDEDVYSEEWSENVSFYLLSMLLPDS